MIYYEGSNGFVNQIGARLLSRKVGCGDQTTSDFRFIAAAHPSRADIRIDLF